MGLIEQPQRFQAVKIDPADSYFFEVKEEANKHARDLIGLSNGKIDSYHSKDDGKSHFVFQHATKEQIENGLLRVAQLTDEKLRLTIYNKQIPDNFMPESLRNIIFTNLKARRDAFRNILNEKGIKWGSREQETLFWLKRNRYKIWICAGAAAVVGVSVLRMGASV